MKKILLFVLLIALVMGCVQPQDQNKLDLNKVDANKTEIKDVNIVDANQALDQNAELDLNVVKEKIYTAKEIVSELNTEIMDGKTHKVQRMDVNMLGIPMVAYYDIYLDTNKGNVFMDTKMSYDFAGINFAYDVYFSIKDNNVWSCKEINGWPVFCSEEEYMPTASNNFKMLYGIDYASYYADAIAGNYILEKKTVNGNDMNCYVNIDNSSVVKEICIKDGIGYFAVTEINGMLMTSTIEKTEKDYSEDIYSSKPKEYIPYPLQVIGEKDILTFAQANIATPDSTKFLYDDANVFSQDEKAKLEALLSENSFSIITKNDLNGVNIFSYADIAVNTLTNSYFTLVIDVNKGEMGLGLSQSSFGFSYEEYLVLQEQCKPLIQEKKYYDAAVLVADVVKTKTDLINKTNLLLYQ